MPDWLLKLFALVRPELKQLVAELGNVRGGDSSHAMTTLGWTMRTPEEAILATAHSLIERGIVHEGVEPPGLLERLGHGCLTE